MRMFFLMNRYIYVKSDRNQKYCEYISLRTGYLNHDYDPTLLFVKYLAVGYKQP